MSFLQLRSPFKRNELGGVDEVRSAAVTGTVTTATEAQIVAGGRTLIITLTSETWVSAAWFDAIRQDIINGLDSGASEAGGWDAVVKATMATSAVVRTSDTVVTITLPAFGTYSITADETITVTVPATATYSSVGIAATPTFTITNSTAAATRVKDMIMSGGIIAFAR